MADRTFAALGGMTSRIVDSETEKIDEVRSGRRKVKSRRRKVVG